MTVVSNGQFWIYTVALLVFWIIVLTTAFNNESNIKNKISLPQTNAEDELKNTGICKNLCKECGCLGFYCGEECICECNDDHPDTECIRKIQINAQSLNVPFEILIQGPTANNFVRTALQFEQNQERKLNGYRNKRSTVTVYIPSQGSPYQQKFSKKSSIKEILGVTDKLKNRRKRSINNDNFDWFSDLRNNLLRPAPLTGRKREVEEPKKSSTKVPRISSIFDNSWIFDSTRNILTPRPLNKLKSPKMLSKVNNENNLDSSIETVNSDVNDEFDDVVGDNRKIDNEYSEQMKNIKMKEKKSFSTNQKPQDESQENLIGAIYSHLFKKDFNKLNDKYSFLREVKKQDESQDYLTGQQQAPSLEDDIDLFSEEVKKEVKKPKKLLENKTGGLSSRLLKNDLTTSQVSSPENIKRGLHQLRIPWFKPGKWLDKFRRVMET